MHKKGGLQDISRDLIRMTTADISRENFLCFLLLPIYYCNFFYYNAMTTTKSKQLTINDLNDMNIFQLMELSITKNIVLKKCEKIVQYCEERMDPEMKVCASIKNDYFLINCFILITIRQKSRI